MLLLNSSSLSLQIKTTKILAYILLISFFQYSCQKKGESFSSDSPTEIEFRLIEKFSADQAGDIFFSHLGYSGGMLSDGSVVFPERQEASLVKIDTTGQLMSSTLKGRGPGELLDLAYITIGPEDEIIVFDQKNGKVVFYDENLELIEELIPPVFESAQVSRIYPVQESEFFFELISFAAIYNPDLENIFYLIQFDKNEERYKKEIELKATPIALRIEGGGAARVPFANSTLTAYHKNSKSIFIYDTSTEVIAEIGYNFDTLKTIPVNLPVEFITKSERDSLDKRLEEYDFESKLPEKKATASRMIVNENRIWLKTNLTTEGIKWAVLNMSGEITGWVTLSEGSMILFINNNIMGVRVNDNTFSLIEYVE